MRNFSSKISIFKNENVKKIYPLLMAISVMIICTGWYIDKRQNKQVIDIICNDNVIISGCIDSIQTDCDYKNLQFKAGEYAMFPHHEKSKLTKDSLCSLLIELKAWYPDMIVAQVEIESGFGVSSLAKNANNVIGMTKTSNRKTTQIKGKTCGIFGVYNNWESCIIDRILWDYAVFGAKKPTRQQYINKLNQVYAYGDGCHNYGVIIDNNSKRYSDMF